MESPTAPFELGEYLTDDSSVEKHTSWLGAEFTFEDKDPASTLQQKLQRTRRLKTVIAVRNLTGVSLKPGQLVQFSTAGGVAFLTGVSGYTATTAQFCAPVDDNVPAAGVPQYAVFYVCVKGPNSVITHSADAGAISVGQLLISVAGATSLESAGSTAGRCEGLTGDTTAMTDDYNTNAFGRALTAVATDGNSETILANICVRY